MGLDRRTFLQQAGLAWFTWGATDAGILSLVNNSRLTALANNYQQLAQPTNRKLALLVGINRYPDRDNLSGCLMDVELQRELLIHRFGFNPSDIITLSDRQATRENIETAFVEHLIQQAKPDDAVVFHFSGYGRQIKMPLSSEVATAIDSDRPDAFRLVDSFVPIDGTPSKKAAVANNILQDTLLVLAQSLSTTKCTFVLDTSFNTNSRSKHGSFKVRSLPDLASGASPSELAFLTDLRQDLADKGLKPSKRLLSLPGVVLNATSKDRIAVERQWDGLSAGLFTYALTQHLWQTTPSTKVQVALARTAETVEQVMGRQQQPTLNNLDRSAISYYLATDDAPNATGVISQINVNGSDLQVKLLGLPASVLDSYGVNSCLSLVSSENFASQLQIKSRDGLTAKAQLLSGSTSQTPQMGELVRESIRMLRRDRSLILAMDADLGRIERVDATSALANIPALDSVVVAGEHNADCLLGKVTKPSSQAEATDSEPAKSTFSYGLYTAGGNLIAKTTGVEEEAVKIALDRLQPQFNSLLAAKWLELTTNEFSSRLKASAALVYDSEKRSDRWQRTTFMSEQQNQKKINFLAAGSSSNSSNGVPVLVKGAEIKLALNNTGEQELYAVILGIDSDCNIFALYTPAESTIETEGQLRDIAIASKSELVIPATESSWKWKVAESIGINTLYVVLAVRPFTRTLKTFADRQNYQLNQEQVLNVTNPIEVVNSLLQDLHDASSVSEELLPSNEVYALNVESWATLNFVYEVVN